MKSPAYREAMDYAVEVLKAVKESGCEMDWPLEQFIKASVRIGAELACTELPFDQEDMLQSYKNAEKNAYLAIYWSDILGRLEDYDRIPVKTLREKCEQLHGMLRDGVKLIMMMTGKDK